MRRAALFLLASVALVSGASAACCNDDVEVLNGGCTDCSSSTGCDCRAENCGSCQGDESCCQRCCTSSRRSSCNCESVVCNSCRAENECCSSCCSSSSSSSSSRCRTGRCQASRQCNSCSCDTCSSPRPSTCCNSCCSSPIVPNPTLPPYSQQPSNSNVTQITTLPNITIIINHAPIYVNNTPVINTEQRCGNASVLTNGTHVVYVYPQNSTCSNRTCCRRRVPRPCYPQPPPLPPVCPPPVTVPDCRPQCHAVQQQPPVYIQPPPPPPPPQQYPCLYYQSWPYVHCPVTGCYGYQCAPPPVQQGCVQVPSWPFLRCLPGGVSGDVYYGSPSYQVAWGDGAAGPAIPFSSTDHAAQIGPVAAGGPAPAGPPFPPAGPGAGFPPGTWQG